MKKVLIAEDDLVLSQLIASELTSYKNQFELLFAENGEKAMQLLIDNRISLLITDIKMPVVDGLELLAHVNDNYPFITCFVMTAYETPELRKKLPKDIRCFFRKPFPPKKLAQEILKVFEEATPQGSINGISVSSFMMMIEMEKKTCILKVLLADGKKGLFYFEKGGLYNAVSGDLRGEDAASVFINRKRAKFSFKPLPEKKIAKQERMNLKKLIQKALDTEKQEDSSPKHNIRELNLPGSYSIGPKGEKGQMTVTNLAISALRMKFHFTPHLTEGNKLVVQFELDDKLESEVVKDVMVTDIDDLFVNADFLSKEHYDRLGPYLHFNGLSHKTW